MQEEYGFVYIWRDKKHKRFYIGCHWGQENDGYICSSVWMKRAQKLRPCDFRRRILKKVYTNKKELFESETYFLNKIKKEEFGKKYYNLKNNIVHWSCDLENSKEIKQKIKKSQEGRPGIKWTNERKIQMSLKLTGRKVSDDTKKKLSEINKGNIFFAGKKHTDATKLKISAANKGKKYFLDKNHSEETKIKMSNSAKNRKKQKMPKSKCPHCQQEGAINGLKRYHFDNCINKA